MPRTTTATTEIPAPLFLQTKKAMLYQKDPCGSVSSLVDPSCGPLFEPMMARYLKSTFVCEFLLDRNAKPIHPSSVLQSFSYACMYYPISELSKSTSSHSLPKPFLDNGDFLIYHRVFDGIAVGTVFNQDEVHSLSAIRDDVMKTPSLSRRPRVRKFAIDLRVRDVEIVEFSWMDDDSLILACRRLYSSSTVRQKRYMLSADFLFFPVLSNPNNITDPPLLRVVLNETPALCQFCGLVGVGVCRCHPGAKVRAPARTYCNFSNETDTAKHFVGNVNNIIGDTDDDFYSNNIQTVHPVAQTWSNYSLRIVDLDQTGAFFCKWYKRSPCRTGLVAARTPLHPIPYQFITGKKSDTSRLITLYLHRIHPAQRTLSADLRLKPPSISDDGNCTVGDEFDAEADLQNSSQDLLGSDDICMSMVSYPPQESLKSVDNTQTPENVVNNDDDSEQSSPETIQQIANHVRPETSEDVSVSNEGVQKEKKQIIKYRDVSSVNKKELLKHFMNIYVKNIRCLPCKKTFSKRGNLVRHIETKHFELKPFECDKCNKRFGHNNHLRRHKEKLHAINSTEVVAV